MRMTIGVGLASESFRVTMSSKQTRVIVYPIKLIRPGDLSGGKVTIKLYKTVPGSEMAYLHCTETDWHKRKQRVLLPVPVSDKCEHFYIVLYFPFGPCTYPTPVPVQCEYTFRGEGISGVKECRVDEGWIYCF